MYCSKTAYCTLRNETKRNENRFFTSQSTDFSLRKVQIFHFAKYRFSTSQSTDSPLRKVQIFHFAKYRFSTSQSTDFPLRKVQIFHFAKYRFSTSQSTDFPLCKVQIFRFLSFRFAKYNKPMKTRCLGAHSGSLNKTLVARTRNLGASGDRAPVRQQPWYCD